MRKGENMADLVEAKQKKKGLSGNMWMYALGVMGINLAIGLVNSYQAEFFNNILGANLMIFAAILLASKFISIVADFVIGNLIDRANFKSGKMRPWILISAFPLAVVTMITFVFIPFNGNEAGMYVYITFMTVLWNVSMTLADIPSQGMLALLSNDGIEKNDAAGLANTLKSIALACPGVIVTIVGMLTGSEVTGKTEYLITAGIMCGLGLVFQLLMYFKTKEAVVSRTSSAMSFKEMFKELKNNKMLIIMFLTYILGFGRNIGLGIAVQATYILVRDGVDLSFLSFLGFEGKLYGPAISWAIGITSAVSSMVTIVFNAAINKKLGEKKYFIGAGLYGFAISVISVIMYCCGGTALRSFWAILVYQFFLGFAYGPNGFLPMVMTSDIVDYQEWKTGKRTEGTQFAILSMANKLSNALSVAVGIFLIGAIGFSASKASGIIETAPDTISSYITDDMQNKAWIIYFLIPGLCMLASSIPMFFYKIDEKTKKQMREELAERRAAEEAAQNIDNDEDGQVFETEEKPVENEPFEEILAEHFEDEEKEVQAEEDAEKEEDTDDDNGGGDIGGAGFAG